MGIQAGIQGIQALGQLGYGTWQMIQARKMAKTLGQRPEFQTPDALKQALGLRRSLAGSLEMAGQSQAEQRMDQALAVGAEDIAQTAPTSTQAGANLVNLYAARMAQQNSLAGQAAQDYQRRQEGVVSALGAIAPYQEKEFMMNQMQPWMDKAATISAMRGAGIQNVFGGLKTGGAAAGQYATNSAYYDALNPKQGAGTTNGGTQGAPTGSLTDYFTPEQIQAMKLAMTIQ